MPRVIWKDEDDVNGEPVGPVTVWTDEDLDAADGLPGIGLPYDPDRPPERWVTLMEAQAIADEHDVDLEVN